ncbi:hypothetical protein CYMTET_30234, partial [Cymbomonas tetramitiformis]
MSPYSITHAAAEKFRPWGETNERVRLDASLLRRAMGNGRTQKSPFDIHGSDDIEYVVKEVKDERTSKQLEDEDHALAEKQREKQAAADAKAAELLEDEGFVEGKSGKRTAGCWGHFK